MYQDFLGRLRKLLSLGPSCLFELRLVNRLIGVAFTVTLTNLFSFHEVLKKEEEERKLKEGTKLKGVNTGEFYCQITYFCIVLRPLLIIVHLDLSR